MTVGFAVMDGALQLDFRGLLTPAGMHAFCGKTMSLGVPIYVLLAMFDNCVVAMTAEELTAFLVPNNSRKLQIPGAILCQVEDYVLFDEHARMAAELGIVRAVFTGAAQASAWTQQRAAGARLVELARLRRVSPFRLRA